MQHIEESELIELVCGRLAGERRDAASGHLLDCPDCREKLREFRQTWQALGDWQVSSGGRDLWPQIEAAASRRRRRIWPLRRWLWAVMKAAAAIILAAGIGHLAARVAPPWKTPAVPAAETDERAAAGSLYLATLGSFSPAGLADALLDPAGRDREEGQ